MTTTVINTMRQHGNDYISRGYRADGRKWREKASHSYVERDRLGSVHAIVAEDGTLEQHTDYHSGGLPSSRRPLAAVDNRLHTGKEFQNFRGVALYDNLARLYDPLTTRFTTVDPLAERTPWLSPYTHCANTPLRLIDSDGPLGEIFNAQLNINSCYSNSKVQYELKGTALTLMESFAQQLNFKAVRRTSVGVSYGRIDLMPHPEYFSSKGLFKDWEYIGERGRKKIKEPPFNMK